MAWNNSKHTFIIGIDAGVKTGLAIWSKEDKKLVQVETTKIHRAMQIITNYHREGKQLQVRVEDARKRKWYGNAGREKLQGAGSVKRDCTIWEDFLKDAGIPYEMVAPKNNRTKLDKEMFTMLTKYTGMTSEHSRDAAMLVFGM